MGLEDDKKEILVSFGPSDSLNDAVISKLIDLKQIYNLNTDDLFINWESFNVTKAKEDLELNLINLDRFQEYLKDSISSKTPQVKREKVVLNSSRKPLTNTNFSVTNNIPATPNLKRRKVLDIGETPYKTPVAKFDSSPNYETANSTFQASSPSSRDRFVKPDSSTTLPPTVQQDSNTILETLNPQVDEVVGYIDNLDIKPFKLAVNFEKAKYQFRTMQMKLLESADVLDDQIDTFAQIYQQNIGKSDTQFGNPCLPSQFDIICSGRIVPDSTAYDHSHQLNASSLFLETSRMSGIGQRIPLDISQLNQYSFFPGQIVILKGKNPTGNTFIVQEILQIPELSTAVTTKEELLEFEQITNNNGLKILITSGPYSNIHTLDFKKLENFVDVINNDIKPHLIIMNGPFIDITNTSVKNGEFQFEDDSQFKNLDDVFKGVFTPILKKISSKIQIILIPSVKDTAIKHCSYPQDSFERKKFGLSKNIRVYPNPCSFSINEAIIGVSNLDIFKDLIEVSKQDSNGKQIIHSRLERIVNHIFEQRRYYPVFPGSLKRANPQENIENLYEGFLGKELSESDIGGSSLEIPYLGLTDLGTSLPDILIIPSELKFFAKVIKGVLVVNPGYFIRANRDHTREDGSYAVVHIQSPSVTELKQDNVEPIDTDLNLYYHNIFKRSRVDIFKS